LAAAGTGAGTAADAPEHSAPIMADAAMTRFRIGMEWMTEAPRVRGT
jgi:hypothetical protein